MPTSSPLSTYSSLLNKLKASKTSSSAPAPASTSASTPAPASTSASTPAPASTTGSSGSAIGGTMPGIGGGVAPGQKPPGYVPSLGPGAIGGTMPGIGGGVAPGQAAPGTVPGMTRTTIPSTRSTRRSY